jgi:hypothetical protein
MFIHFNFANFKLKTTDLFDRFRCANTNFKLLQDITPGLSQNTSLTLTALLTNMTSEDQQNCLCLCDFNGLMTSKFPQPCTTNLETTIFLPPNSLTEWSMITTSVVNHLPLATRNAMPLSPHRTVTGLTTNREVSGSSPDMGPGIAMIPLFPQLNTFKYATMVFFCFKELRHIRLIVFSSFTERHDAVAWFYGCSGFETRPAQLLCISWFSSVIPGELRGHILKSRRNLVIYTRLLVLLG